MKKDCDITRTNALGSVETWPSIASNTRAKSEEDYMRGKKKALGTKGKMTQPNFQTTPSPTRNTERPSPQPGSSVFLAHRRTNILRVCHLPYELVWTGCKALELITREAFGPQVNRSKYAPFGPPREHAKLGNSFSSWQSQGLRVYWGSNNLHFVFLPTSTFWSTEKKSLSQVNTLEESNMSVFILVLWWTVLVSWSVLTNWFLQRFCQIPLSNSKFPPGTSSGKTETAK